MPFVVFDERFKTGYPEIDRRNAELFDAINRLHDVMVAGHSHARVNRAVVDLRRCTTDHFGAEESLMVESRYPAVERHRTAHDTLAAKALELENSLEAGSVMWSITTLLFIREWLVQHIDGEGRQLADHLLKGFPTR